MSGGGDLLPVYEPTQSKVGDLSQQAGLSTQMRLGVLHWMLSPYDIPEAAQSLLCSCMAWVTITRDLVQGTFLLLSSTSRCHASS